MGKGVYVFPPKTHPSSLPFPSPNLKKEGKGNTAPPSTTATDHRRTPNHSYPLFSFPATFRHNADERQQKGMRKQRVRSPAVGIPPSLPISLPLPPFPFSSTLPIPCSLPRLCFPYSLPFLSYTLFPLSSFPSLLLLFPPFSSTFHFPFLPPLHPYLALLPDPPPPQQQNK